MANRNRTPDTTMQLDANGQAGNDSGSALATGARPVADWEPGATRQDEQAQQVGDNFAVFVNGCAQAATSARAATGVDQRLLESQRAWMGRYSADKLAQLKEAGISTRFLNITGEKASQVEAAIREVVLPAYERPFGIAPRKRPQLPPMDMEPLGQMVMQRAMEMMGGQEPPPELVHELGGQVRDAMDEAVHREAQDKAHAMEDLIVDQLKAGDYHPAMAKALINFTWSLTTFLEMGVEQRRVGEWVNGKFQMVQKPCWVFFAPSPFDQYFSPECGGFNDGYYLRRLRSTRAEVSRLNGVPGYQNIEKVLKAHEHGGDSPIQQTDPERQLLESKQVPGAKPGTSDDRIEGWKFEGTASGTVLREWGMSETDIPDETMEYHVVGVVYGQHTIKLKLNDDPQGKWSVVGTSFRPMPNSIWGQSLPEVLETPQAMMNSAVRASQDNVAFASRPMSMVNMSRLSKSSKKHANILAPGKVYVVEEPQSGVTSIKPVEFFNVPMETDKLGRYIDRAAMLADRNSGFPSLSYGDSNVGAAAGTARGLAMLIKGASKLGRAMIGNIGTEMVLELVKRLFYDNMLHVEDDSIKGDCVVDARGTLQALLREDLDDADTEILQLALKDQDVRAVIGGWRGLAMLLRKKAKSAEFFGLVLTDAELERQERQALMEARAQGQGIQRVPRGGAPAGGAAGAPAEPLAAVGA